ncbi:xanthine dehydrogenase family protein molybdopterin-binding subunit [Pseudohalocynthiibacter aestuariivivens]|nr:molybdopterin cofactor-binding domain-containing protein [Pseudohalocynthiibacter aestuariivivens]QIE44600.1 xanthine dehydrogenase family protein molybdopterin-binding subunit [Pseudohalocynthiibacter aestuariivivens]
MSKAGKIARRTFLVGSAAVAGGVAFGIYQYRRAVDNPLLDGLPEGSAALTPYVRIDADGITLITPRADKGQGAYHVQAALIAEELDVALDQITVDPGPPSPAYWNTALSEEAAAFAMPGDGLLNSTVHGTIDAVMKFMGMQITGGSTTVPDGFVKLRAAGASARETLKRAAAMQSSADLPRLRTKDGAVILPDGRALPYTSLAATAATLEVAQDVPLRPASEWRLIGKPMQRLDMMAKCTGTLNYGIDLTVPDMLHATVLLGPAPGSQLRSYDADTALAAPGILAVVPVTGGLGIVAKTTWHAFRAADLIKAEWAPAPFPSEMEAHWQALANSFTNDHRDSRPRDDGDVADAFQGTGTISAEYRAPYLAHAPLEPLSAIVLVNNGQVEVWTGTQIPRFVQSNVAKIAKVKSAAVTVHAAYIGGSFGHRLEDTVVRQATEIAMQMPGTPIKLTYSRETDMRHDYMRQPAMARMRGAHENGQVTAFDLSIAMPSIIASQMGRQSVAPPGPDSQIVAGAWDQPFAIPHHRVTGHRAPELAPISSWRSVGASTGGFFYNLGLDEIIHAAGADPLHERLRLCSDPLAQAALESVAKMSNWSGPNPGTGIGRGVALTHSFGVPCAEIVEVRQTDRGLRITDAWVAAEVGTVVDPVNFENLVAGGVIWGLGHAMNCQITYQGGTATQTNYHDFEGMRLHQCPRITVQGLENGEQVRGIGEPPVPPAAPALAGAIFAATGVRIREMPFNKFVDFA